MEALIQQLTDALSSLISVEDHRAITEFLEYREWGVAWNSLWGALSEGQQYVEKAHYDRLVDLGIEMGVPDEVAYLQKTYPIKHG